MSNKKRNARLEKELKQYIVHRYEVYSGFEMLKISLGLLFGFSHIKAYKLRSAFFGWLGKGPATSTAVKFGLSLVAKKLILVFIAISGFIYGYGKYKKLKSLKPVLISENGLTVFYPGPFRKQIEVWKKDIKAIEYKREEKKLSLFFKTKNGGMITVKLKENEKLIPSILSISRNCISKKMVDISN